MSLLHIELGSNEKRATGGGWIPVAASANGKANFGFTVNYQRNGNPKGNSVFLIKGTDGFNYLVKSNSWSGGGLAFGFGSNSHKASFTGRCVIQKINRVTGELVASQGNCQFTCDIEDGDLLNPRQTDKYGIRILGSDGTLWFNSTILPLGGGNVTVRSR